jgi:hypothetical protein
MPATDQFDPAIHSRGPLFATSPCLHNRESPYKNLTFGAIRVAGLNYRCSHTAVRLLAPVPTEIVRLIDPLAVLLAPTPVDRF